MNESIDSSNVTQKKFKIVFLGDQGAGKTSMIKRFIYDAFDESNQVTLSSQFSIISISIRKTPSSNQLNPLHNRLPLVWISFQRTLVSIIGLLD